MRWLLTAGLALALTPLGPAHAADALEPFRVQELAWRSCGQGTWCASMQVPLDHADPSRDRITLSLRSLGTAPPDGSRPALLVNPGGPGSSATDFVPYFGGVVGRSVREAYDIVGVDPRGVGDSTPIECLTGRETTRWLRTDPSPDTPGEESTYLRRAAAISEGCLRQSARIAPYVGTGATVRDMDLVRSVLGQETLNWFGYSYGTQLGAQYAQLFPDRVGRMVLDGAVDPSLDTMQLSRGQSRGFQTALRRFAADCARQPDCALGTSTDDVLRTINALLASLDSTPLRTKAGPPLVQAEAVAALFFSMYSKDLWPVLGDALVAARRGDGTDLAALAAIANDRSGPDTYDSNINSAFLAIGCWDYPAPPGRKGLASAARRWAKDAEVPELARAIAWGNAPCTTWFEHAPMPPGPVASTTSSPIVIIGTMFDPATPYAWSRNLAAQLPTSRLLTFEGDGHTAYGDGSACVQNYVDDYLVRGTLPPVDARC